MDKVFTASGAVNTQVLDTGVRTVVQQVQQITKELLAQDGLRAISKVDANRRVVFTAEGFGTSLDAGATYEEVLTADGVNLANSFGNLPIERVDGLQIELATRLDSARGTTTERPTLTTADDGFVYYDRTLLKLILWNGTAWRNVNGTTL